MRNNVSAAESLEDIQKEYDSEVAKYNEDMKAYKKKRRAFYAKDKQVQDAVQRWVEDRIFTSCSAQFMQDTDIIVGLHKYSTEDHDYNALAICVKHEGQHGFYDNDNVALKWTWSIEVDSSIVQHSTNSYSGLNAVTRDNIKELHESVSVMEKLAAISDSDFIKLRSKVNSEKPDIVTELGAEPTRVNDNSFFWRKVNALAGTDDVVETERYITNYGSQQTYPIYYRIVKVNQKSVVVDELAVYSDLEVRYMSTGKRISREKFIDSVVRPLNVVNVRDLYLYN